MKRKKSAAPWIILLVLIVIGLGGFAAYEYTQLEDKDATILNYQAQQKKNTKTVYIATRDINMGEKFVEEGDGANVQLQNIASGLESSFYLTEVGAGDKALVAIPAGSPIMMNDVTKVETTVDERFYELVETLPMTTQNNYDVVDVRVVFPDGEDYLVLTNKQVKDLNLASCIFTIKMTEDEILRYQSACVDAYLTGGMLYTTKYVEPVLQTNTAVLVPDYPVRSIVADITTNWDTNTKYDSLVMATLNKQVRRELAARLGLSENDLLLDEDGNVINDAVINGFSSVQEEKKSVISERTDDLLTEEDYETQSSYTSKSTSKSKEEVEEAEEEDE